MEKLALGRTIKYQIRYYSNFATAGVPRGSILGPLLFLMYVNDLPSIIKAETIMFADDTTCLSHGHTVEIVSTGVQGDLNSLYEYARKNHLVPHPDKTKVVIFHKKRQIIEDRPLLTLGENVVEYVNSYKCLEFTLDESLQYDLHVKDICRKMNYRIQIIKRVKFYLPKEYLITIANSHVLCHLDYCAPLLHNLSAAQVDKLLKLQKYCARLIYGYNRLTPSRPLFIELNWLPVYQRIEYLTSCLMFNIMNKTAPSYLIDIFKESKTIHTYNTRHSGKKNLFIARGKGTEYTKTFQFFGSKLWNSLPTKIKQASSKEKFKKHSFNYFMGIIKSVNYTHYKNGHFS